MTRAMIRLCVSATVLLLVVAVGEAAPKAKQVKCQDRAFPDCFHKKLHCPDACLRTCVVNCASCQPVCSLTPPSLPPYTPTPTTPFPPLTPPLSPSSPPPPSTPSTPPSPPLSPPVLPPTLTPSPPPPAPSSPLTPPLPPLSPPVLPPTLTPSPPPLPPSTPSTPSLPPLSPPPSPPPGSASAPRRAYCMDINFPRCYRQGYDCPSTCPDHCEVDSVTCKPVCNCDRPGTVCQDPRFVGGDGITFYFHGKKDKDFCIVSDSNLHINAHFIGRRDHHMKRDFTWVQSLGILFDNHQLFMGAKKSATWDGDVDRLELSFDGEPIFLSQGKGTKWSPTTGVSISRTRGTNSVVIEVEGNFLIKATVVPITQKDSLIHNYGVTDDDCFAHLDLGFKFDSLSGYVNGVLGQTYASNYVSRVKMGVLMPVLGGDKEFSSSTIFATDCLASRFNNDSSNSSHNYEHASLNCATGFDGHGVVCKR